jgi:N-acetylglucosamine-6-sulfatase
MRAAIHAIVTIDGTGLGSTTSVMFGSTTAPFTIESDSRVIAGVPDGASTGPIAVTTSSGSAVSNAPFVVEPNIVLILTDDQRFDEVANMPNVGSELVDKGTTFSNAFVSNPLCCPSRATIQTGEYSHSTHVYSNSPDNGGWETFHGSGDDRSTIATWLRAAGYRTALIGKYMNGYILADASYIPPGWNRWVAWAPHQREEPGYYDYPLSVDGVEREYGSAPQDYSTDVLASYAKTFIRRTPTARPLFLWFAPRAPHGGATPPVRYEQACLGVKATRYSDSREADVSDKPFYIRSRPLPGIYAGDGQALRHCQSLLAVDDAVNVILRALSDTGRLSNTMIVFMSDNGLLWNEHRWQGKQVPYEESIHVPLVVRYDPMTAGMSTTDTHLIVNTDFAPTWAQLAGVDAPGVEGASFLPLLDGSGSTWRNDFLLEHTEQPGADPVPTYCGVRTTGSLYVEYSTGEVEMYDLTTDPYELQNEAGDPTHAAQQLALHERLVKLCDPPPPGFTP